MSTPIRRLCHWGPIAVLGKIIFENSKEISHSYFVYLLLNTKLLMIGYINFYRYY